LRLKLFLPDGPLKISQTAVASITEIAAQVTEARR
jgi:hypothetical protein